MIDIEHMADRVVETVVVPPPKMSWVRERARQRRRRRRAALWGTMALPFLVFAGVAWNLADQNPGQQVIVGIDAEQLEGLAIPGFEWFEGDGFRVQLPVGWKLEEFDVVPYLDPEWTAWLPIAIDVPASLSPSSFAPLSAEIWTTIDTWESANSWAQVNFPSTIDEVNFVDFPPITISSRAVSGAVEGVRGEQRYLESYVSDEVEPTRFTDFKFAHGVGVAGLRPDGRVTVFWLTERDLDMLDELRLGTATIDIILDSFTLTPLPEVREVGTGGLNSTDIISSLSEGVIEEYGDVVFSLVRRSEFIDVYVGYGEDERICVIASYSTTSQSSTCVSQTEFVHGGLLILGRDRPGYPVSVVAVVPEDTISAFLGNYQLTIVDSVIAEVVISDSMVFTLHTEHGSIVIDYGHASENEIAAESDLPPLSAVGPSQSPEDAARDGVIAEVAERSLRERSEPLFSAESTDGTWILGRLPIDTDADPSANCVGDESGTYPLDFVCHGYFEALLIDEDG